MDDSRGNKLGENPRIQRNGVIPSLLSSSLWRHFGRLGRYISREVSLSGWKFVAEYGQTQSHKRNCRSSRYGLGESSDVSARLGSNLDGEVEFCHSNSCVGQ